MKIKVGGFDLYFILRSVGFEEGLTTLRAAHGRSFLLFAICDHISKFDLTHVVCFKIHSSSANSRAELRLPGSHWSILRMKRRNNSLSSLLSSPCRDVSRSSSIVEQGMGIPAEKTPLRSAIVSLVKR